MDKNKMSIIFMKKTTTLFILSILFFSCKKKEITKTIDTSAIQGEWILSEYMDSIMENKSVAKHRMNPAAQGSILLQIIGDTIHNYGSVYYHGINKLELNGDTILNGTKHTSCKYFICGDKLCVTDCYKDKNIYHYRRLKDIESKILEGRNPRNIEKNLSEVIMAKFNRFFYNKRFRDLENNKIYEFGFPYHISGWNNFKYFEVNKYWGTLHPFNNKDILAVKNKTESEYWNFKFQGDTIYLRKMILPKTSDNYELSGKSKTLIKTK